MNTVIIRDYTEDEIFCMPWLIERGKKEPNVWRKYDDVVKLYKSKEKISNII